MSITLKDLAKITGYSTITISRAINHPELVKEKSLEKILHAISKYHYFPNNVAKALVYNRTNIIYLYIPYDLGPTNQFVMQVNAGIGSYLGDHGYSILISKKWYQHEAVDGLILMGLTIEDEENLKNLALEKPLVLFGHSDSADCIDVDNIKGMEIITEHAIQQGYKNIAFLGISESKKFTKDRYIGFKNALERDGRKENPNYTAFTDNNSEAGYMAGLRLLTKYPEIDCFVCSSDDLAAGVIQASRLCDREVPKTLGVTGFDGLGTDLIIKPNLTTIHQPIFEVGVELAKLLIKKITHPKTNRVSVNYYLPQLKIGDSTRKQ